MPAPISPDRQEAVIAAYQAGVMVKDIVQRFSVSSDSVRKIVGTAGIGRGMAQRADWSDERIERMKKLWVEGLSASQIASELGGVTRNAVIGKIHRLGVTKRLDPMRQPRSAKVKHEQRNIEPLKPVARKLRGDGFKTTTIPLRLAAPVVAYVPAKEVIIPVSRNVSIMELRDGVCRWPLGDPLHADFVFCGGDCNIGRPYCAAHTNVAVVVGADRTAAMNSMARVRPK